MYIAAHQGDRNQGPNTNITLIANEFTPPIPPGQATNPTPTNGATDVPTQILLRWDAATGATSYEVFLGNEESISSIGIPLTAWINSPDLIPGEVYLWRVDAINDAGVTTGELWSFITEGGSEARDAILPRAFTVSQAFPNPFNSNVNVTLSLPQSGRTRVTVYDVIGREVFLLADQLFTQGEHRLTWNAVGNSAGSYLIKCDCNGLTLTQKVVYLP
jgi:hypothetical protein